MMAANISEESSSYYVYALHLPLTSNLDIPRRVLDCGVLSWTNVPLFIISHTLSLVACSKAMHIMNKRNGLYYHPVPNPTHILDRPARSNPLKRSQSVQSRARSKFVLASHVATSSPPAPSPPSAPSLNPAYSMRSITASPDRPVP
jgi:hypothetical protein